MELEIIQTHNIMTTRLNKRLRQEVEDNENLPSSQESKLSQSMYNPDSESSVDTDNVLEPMVLEARQYQLEQNLVSVPSCMLQKISISRITNRNGENGSDESIFIDFALTSFVNAVFPVSHMLQKSSYFTALEGDANLKPDIKFHTSIDRKKFDCLLVEVKCPKSTSDDDLFKLSIEMQYILNRLVEYGTSNPVVYGVLVYGMWLNN
ncbi:hypothetical protein G6F62_003359 [Rhizopus arrhizus]|nr:hypothetical protein G6F62_003359 [Rhizopus arrhizus]